MNMAKFRNGWTLETTEIFCYYPYLYARRHHGVIRVVCRIVREQNQLQPRYALVIERLSACETRTQRDVWVFNTIEAIEKYQSICATLDASVPKWKATRLSNWVESIKRALSLKRQQEHYKPEPQEP